MYKRQSKHLIDNQFKVFVAFFKGTKLQNPIFVDSIKISTKKDSLLEFKKFLEVNRIKKVINFIWDLNIETIEVIKASNCIYINSLREHPLYFYKITKNLKMCIRDRTTTTSHFQKAISKKHAKTV